MSHYFSNDTAIGLGTANTLVYLRDKGAVLDKPPIVVMQNTSGGRGAVVAVDTEAKKVQGRAPCNIHIIRPVKDGVIAGFDIAERMLGLLIKRVIGGRTVIPSRVVICVPGGSTQVECKAARDSVLAAGAASIHLIEEPMAAALGTGLPIRGVAGSMVVGIGGGMTEIGILSLNGLAYPDSIRVGGDTFDEAIAHHLRRNRGVIIGEIMMEEIKRKIGTVLGDDKTTAITVKGRGPAEGTSKLVAITSDEVREVSDEPLSQIVRSARPASELASPEPTGGTADRRLVLTGGGVLLKGMDLLLADTTELPVDTVGEPLNCVTYGAGKTLGYVETLDTVFVKNM